VRRRGPAWEVPTGVKFPMYGMHQEPAFLPRWRECERILEEGRELYNAVCGGGRPFVGVALLPCGPFRGHERLYVRYARGPCRGW
jgi:hypothetical protein